MISSTVVTGRGLAIAPEYPLNHRVRFCERTEPQPLALYAQRQRSGCAMAQTRACRNIFHGQLLYG